jgi:hypothetical protein
MEFAPSAGCVFYPLNILPQHERESVAPPDHLEAHPFFPQLLAFQTEEGAQETKDGLYFIWRTAPVIRRKGIQSETPYPELWRMLDRAARCCDSRPMTRNAGQSTPRSPAPVSVHDDGDMQGRPRVTL